MLLSIFALLKKLPLKLILLVLMFISLGFIIYTLYEENKQFSSDNTMLTNQVVKLQKDATIIESSNRVNDQVVTEYVKEVDETKERITANNQKSISNYVNQAKAKPQVIEVPPNDGSARVIDLTIGLWHTYCTTRPEDPQCNSVIPKN